MEERIDTYEAKEVWMHGLSDEHPDRLCFNCGNAVDLDRLENPDKHNGSLLCPDCGAELPWASMEEVPKNDWFNWACLEKTDYRSRLCFDEPTQKALRLTVSVADPRGGDMGLEITETNSGDLLVKVENGETLTYAKYAGTTVEGSYTVVRFNRR